jgi:arginine decarboxylase
VEDAQVRGLKLPLLIRFSDILEHRIASLSGSFLDAMEREGYGGRFVLAYPVKVNQQRQVLDEVVRFGTPHGIGLEAGSKPELHAVLAMSDAPNAVVICNGYKDAAYIRLALRAQKLGKLVFLVLEKPGELDLVLRIAREENVAPRLGVRIKLVTAGSGKWEDSGGDRSKFGLTAAELLQAIELLKREGKLEWFQLAHFHLGSQISNIRAIKEALREMGRYYVELRRLGCSVSYVDVGGGLGVDYDGTRTTHGFSINYTEHEYAAEVVGALAEVCRAEGLPHPDLITESGRALTAHHAMLVVNVLETTSLGGEGGPIPAEEDEHELAVKMRACLAGLGARSLFRGWEEAQYLRDEAGRLFELGYLSLRERALLERLFWKIARRVERLMRGLDAVPEEHAALEALLADKYFCNFSVFQSLPDAWAIGQEFPVVPLQRLHEQPTRKGILQDITCDSDGKIASYIGAPEKKRVLPLHPLRRGEAYYLGIFLTGAYQEILGELHNLFGDPDVLHVAQNEDGSWRYEQIVHGESVASVLGYVQFHRSTLLDRIDRQVNESVRNGRMTHSEGRAFRSLYQEGLDALPYLDGAAEGKKARRGARHVRAG